MSNWIAVVDDEAMSLTSIRRILNERGMKVSCFRSGMDFMTFMEKNEPDLVLLDLMMPKMDGFATFKALRNFEEENKRKQTPVIFVTGDNNTDAEKRGLKEGASDFIRKPINKDILLERINNTLENSRKIQSLTIEATHDKLTGFYNKVTGSRKIAACCREKVGALMVIDIDNFKLVNDIFGHDMGDKVLMALASVIRHNTRDEDIVSRIGGDEAMAFFVNMITPDAVDSLVTRLNSQFLSEVSALLGEDHDIPLGISAGVSFIPEHGKEYERLFLHADNSLLRAKQNGKHGYLIYDPFEKDDDPQDNFGSEMQRLTKLAEERGDMRGALILGQDAFISNYRFIIRFIKRYNGKATKVLFHIKAAPGGDLEDVMGAFSDVLVSSLRRSDIIMQNRSNQFFLLLPQLSEENTPTVINRILSAWEATGFKEGIQIDYLTENITYEDL